MLDGIRNFFKGAGKPAEPNEEPVANNEEYEEMIRQLQDKLQGGLKQSALFDLATSKLLASINGGERMFDRTVCSMIRRVNEFYLIRSGRSNAGRHDVPLYCKAVFPLEKEQYCVMIWIKNFVWVMMLDKEYGRPGITQTELLEDIQQRLREKLNNT